MRRTVSVPTCWPRWASEISSPKTRSAKATSAGVPERVTSLPRTCTSASSNSSAARRLSSREPSSASSAVSGTAMRDRTGAGFKSVKSTASCSARPLWHGRCDTVDATAGVRQFAVLSAITARTGDPAPERLGDPGTPQCPRKASASHHDPPSDAIGACTSSGALRGPATQSATPPRSAGARTVTASNPYPRPIAARSVSGNVTVAWSRPGSGAPRRHSRGRCRRRPASAAPAGRTVSSLRRHQRAAVAERGDRQPVRPGERGADRRGEPQPDRLERLREAEPGLVGTAR